MLTYRFWTRALNSDPSVLGKTVRLGRSHRDDRRRARAVGALSGRNRDHRQRGHEPAPSVGDDGRRPRPPDDRALRPARAWRPTWTPRAPSCAPCTARLSRSTPSRIPRPRTSGSTPSACAIRLCRRRARCCWCCWPPRRSSSSSPARTSPTSFWRARCGAKASWRFARRSAPAPARFDARCSRRACCSCGAGAILGVVDRAADGRQCSRRYAARFSVRALDLTVDASLLWVGVALALIAAVVLAFVPRLPSSEASSGIGVTTGSVRMTSGTNRRLAALRGDADCRVVRAACRRGHAADGASRAAVGADGLQDEQRARAERAARLVLASAGTGRRLLQGSAPPHLRAAGCRASRGRNDRAVARCRHVRAWIPVLGRRLCEGERRRGSAGAIPHGLARLLQRAWRADRRRARFLRRRSSRGRARRHRQREPGAPDVRRRAMRSTAG